MNRETNWHVITGAPCSGKTTLIRALASHGHKVVNEVARSYINEQLARGVGLDQMKADLLAFEREIFKQKLTLEAALPKTDLIFLDRAVPDSIAYYRLNGLDSSEVERASRFVRYKRVLFCDRLALQTDDVRKEDQAVTIELERLLWDCYGQLGYDLVRIPAVGVEDRLRLVL